MLTLRFKSSPHIHLGGDDLNRQVFAAPQVPWTSGQSWQDAIGYLRGCRDSVRGNFQQTVRRKVSPWSERYLLARRGRGPEMAIAMRREMTLRESFTPATMLEGVQIVWLSVLHLWRRRLHLLRDRHQDCGSGP